MNIFITVSNDLRGQSRFTLSVTLETVRRRQNKARTAQTTGSFPPCIIKTAERGERETVSGFITPLCYYYDYVSIERVHLNCCALRFSVGEVPGFGADASAPERNRLFSGGGGEVIRSMVPDERRGGAVVVLFCAGSIIGA